MPAPSGRRSEWSIQPHFYSYFPLKIHTPVQISNPNTRALKEGLLPAAQTPLSHVQGFKIPQSQMTSDSTKTRIIARRLKLGMLHWSETSTLSGSIRAPVRCLCVKPSWGNIDWMWLATGSNRTNTQAAAWIEWIVKHWRSSGVVAVSDSSVRLQTSCLNVSVWWVKLTLRHYTEFTHHWKASREQRMQYKIVCTWGK